jgi:hypothetical protein
MDDYLMCGTDVNSQFGQQLAATRSTKMPTGITGIDNEDLACCSACSCERAALNAEVDH